MDNQVISGFCPVRGCPVLKKFTGEGGENDGTLLIFL